ncbi:uncharacterized protein LOC111477863 [Cucurbita maxima]|uniref:Uncharacterized protein LOC111477863 n=1 Tax=Cucurbita maxima TaxID=3661 RepID=A0A6J1IRS3_CUCMA|nr:uncharacterized protein LOC111477863 [Cucurbita maxima]
MLVFLWISHEPLKPRKSLGVTWCLVEVGHALHRYPDNSGIWRHHGMSFIFPFPYENGPQTMLFISFFGQNPCSVLLLMNLNFPSTVVSELWWLSTLVTVGGWRLYIKPRIWVPLIRSHRRLGSECRVLTGNELCGS